MSKKIMLTILFSAAVLSLFAGNSVFGQNTQMNGAMMNDMVINDDGHTGMVIDMGPALGGQMLHVYIDLLAFLISLFLVMKIGRGKIRYPIMLLGIGFFVSALIPPFAGHHLMWLVALIKSVTITFAMIWFLGVFGLLSGAPKQKVSKTQEQ